MLMAEQEYRIHVDGMMCTHCAGIVSKALTGLAGVLSVKANADRQLVELRVDPQRVQLDEIKAAIEDQGYEVRAIETA